MAGRIRSVKPELIADAQFAALTDGAARLYYGLLAVVDDCGRCPAAPSFLAGQIFWGRQRSAGAIGRLLAELAASGIVELYSVRGGRYLQIAGWSDKTSCKYQRIDKHQGERYPAPGSSQSSNGSEIDSSTDSTSDLISERISEGSVTRARAIPGPVPQPPPQPAAAPAAQEPPPKIVATEDPDLLARRALKDRKLRQLEDLRARVARQLGLQYRPLPAFSDRELSDRIREAAVEAKHDLARVEQDIDHVLAVREAEALVKGSVEWLTGGMFEERSWRRALGQTLQDARRRLPPRPSEPAPPLRLAAPADDVPPMRFPPLERRRLP